MRLKNRLNVKMCFILTGLFALSGCAKPHATVDLFHPSESGSQELVQLSSEWAKYGHAEDGDSACLILEWPLPGSRYGTKQYLLYVRMPAGKGVFEVGDPILSAGEQDTLTKGDTPPEPREAAEVVSGFLIQRTGRLKGVTHLVSGSIEIRGRSLRIRGGSLQKGALDLICADQTEIQGEFVAKPGFRVSFFESKHQQDIANAISVAKGQPVPLPTPPK